MNSLSQMFSRRNLVPVAIIGAAITFTTMLYSGSLFSGFNPSSTVSGFVAKGLGAVGLSTSSGFGYYVNMFVNFLVTGLLTVGSLMIAAQLQRIPLVRSLEGAGSFY